MRCICFIFTLLATVCLSQAVVNGFKLFDAPRPESTVVAQSPGDVSVETGPLSFSERLGLYNLLMHDLETRIAKTNQQQQQKAGQQVRRSGDKERRAPMETFDEWEGMMESLDSMRKPRFGK